jgi:hypothetical protein
MSDGIFGIELVGDVTGRGAAAIPEDLHDSKLNASESERHVDFKSVSR